MIEVLATRLHGDLTSKGNIKEEKRGRGKEREGRWLRLSGGDARTGGAWALGGFGRLQAGSRHSYRWGRKGSGALDSPKLST